MTTSITAPLTVGISALPAGPVHYELAGPDHGPLVVLVHGNAGPMWIWDRVVSSLHEAGMRTLRYDLYGRGQSARPKQLHTRDMYDNQLTRLLDRLAGFGPIDLVGTSQGGAIAATFAARHPERVRRLALLAPIMDDYVAPGALRLLRLPFVGAWLGERIGGRGSLRRLDSLFSDGRAPADFVERFREQLREPGFGRSIALNACSDALDDHTDAYRTLAESGIPTLLVWGTSDRAITAKMIGRTRAVLSHARYVELEGAGHVAQWERSEAVASALLEFLG